MRRKTTAKDWFSKTQLEGARRLCDASFTRRHLFNRYLFLQGPVRTFMVRTCMPATDKMYVRALRLDPCSFCQSEGRYLSTIVPAPPMPKRRTQKQDLFNMTATCRSCGSCKRDTPLLHFMLEQTPEPESPHDLLRAIIDLTETRGSRFAIGRLARQVLATLDRETDRAST